MSSNPEQKDTLEFPSLRWQAEVEDQLHSESPRVTRFELYSVSGPFLNAGQAKDEKWAGLFASAPDLYVALEGLVTFHQGHVCPPELQVKMTAARAALKKARGEGQ